jgi:hypothetical protein
MLVCKVSLRTYCSLLSSNMSIKHCSAICFRFRALAYEQQAAQKAELNLAVLQKQVRSAVASMFVTASGSGSATLGGGIIVSDCQSQQAMQQRVGPRQTSSCVQQCIE